MKIVLKNTQLVFAVKHQEVSAFAKAAIAASGNTEMPINQQYALSAFFSAIGADVNSSIWQKLSCIYLPMICGNNTAREKAMLNYKGNVSDTTVVRDGAFEANYSYENYGLVYNGPTEGRDSYNRGVNPPVNMNLHSFTCFTALSSGGRDTNILGQLANDQNKSINVLYSNDTRASIKIAGEKTVNLTVDKVFGAYGDTTQFGLFTKNNKIDMQFTDTNQYEFGTYKMNFIGTNSGQQKNNNSPICAIIYGEGMTESDRLVVVKALEDLVKGFVN